MKINLSAWMTACAISAAVSHSLPAQTHVDLRTQIKSADLSSVGPTKPAQTGAVLPATCGIGELFFLTSAPAGSNVMVCASVNVWSSGGGGGGALAFSANATSLGNATTLNVVPGTYVTQTISCVAGTCSYQPDVDTTKIPGNAAIQAGQLVAVVTTSASSTTYTGVMASNDPIAAYAANQQLIWNVGATACTAGAITLNIDALGAIPVKQADGATNLTAAQCGANAQLALTYDAVNRVFRGPMVGGGGGGGAVSSVFGRTGAVVAAANDYSYNQISGTPSVLPAPPPTFNGGSQTAYYNFRQPDPAAGNLLLYSNTFSNAAWTAQGSTVTGGQADPLGGTNAWKIAEDGSTQYHDVNQAVSNLYTWKSYTLAGYVAASTGRTWAQITTYNGAIASSFINLATCAAGSIATGATLTVASSTGGYCAFAYTFYLASTSYGFYLGPASGNGSGSYAGTAGNGILLYHTGFFAGTGAPSAWTDTPRGNITITDQSGNGNSGTLVGAALVSGGVQFTGTAGQYVSLPSAAHSAFTWAATVDVSSLVNGANPGGPVIGSDTAGNFALYYSDAAAGGHDNRGRWTVKNGSSVVTLSADTCTGPVKNVIATQNGDGGYVRLFCDGTEMQYFQPITTTFAHTGTVQIGADPQNSAYGTMEVWNVSLWSGALPEPLGYGWAQFSIGDTASKGISTAFNSSVSNVLPPASTSAVVCLGDSITAGYGVSMSYCNQANTGLTPTYPYNAYNYGQISEMAQTVIYRLNGGGIPWTLNYLNPAAQTRVIVIYAGTNDITSFASAATAANYLWQGVQLAKSSVSGVKVLVATAISRTGSGIDATIATFNNLVRNNWLANNADGVLDFGAIGVFAPNGSNNSNSSCYLDGVHPTQACANTMAVALTAALNRLNSTQVVTFGTPTANTCHAQYSFSNDGGAIGTITPLTNCWIPANSTIKSASIRWTTAAVGAGASAAIGVSGTGGSATALLGATAAASLTGQVQGAVTAATSTWPRITTAGAVTLTVSGAALTAGIAEVTVQYETTAN